jgi:hypothetical protein
MKSAAFEPLERRALLSGSPSPVGPAELLADAGLEFAHDNVGELSSGDFLSRAKDDKDDDDDDDEKEKEDDKGRDDDDDDGRGDVDAAPRAQITAGNVTARSGDAHTIAVVYTDDAKLRAKTIGTDDIVVSAPNGPNLAVTGVTLSPDDDAGRIVATYSLAAPGGRWDAADNGTYTVTVKPMQVFDAKQNPVASTSASFQVNVAVNDVAAPTAIIDVDDVAAGGGSSHRVTVTYRDDVGVVPQTVGPADLTISGPGGGTRPVRSVSVNASSDGTVVAATYTFGAPGAAWGPEDNGSYTVRLNPDAVRDAAGKGATASPVTFTVNVPLPQPIDPDFGGGNGGGGSGGGRRRGGGGGGAGAPAAR